MIDRNSMANFRFGGGASGTALHPAVAVGMLVALLLILCGSRKHAVTPFVLAFFTIPAFGQVLVLAGVHFTMQQILILTVLARMAVSGGSTSGGRFSGGFSTLDRLAVLWSLLSLIVFFLEWPEAQALIKGTGDLVLNLGGYLAARFLIPDREAIRRTVKALAVICVIQGVCMLSEQFTPQNLFGVFGGAPTEIREGHIRAQGAMGTIYGGAFAGIVSPLFFWLWKEKGSRMMACAGMAGAAAMAFSCHASTAWMAYGGSLVALGFWPLRKQMRLVRWVIVGTLVGLHLVMNGPVWSLIEHIDLSGGSSSYHRYILVDNCIRHFSDWWLIGYKYYSDWGYDMYDLCNEFVGTALTGGLVTLILFITFFKQGFAAIGNASKHADRKEQRLLWCLGSALFATVVASFGINYMVHLKMCFLCLLVMISVATTRSSPGYCSERVEAPEENESIWHLQGACN